MEDAHIAAGTLPDAPDMAFFAVFDGHGGDLVANMSKDKLLPAVFRTEALRSGNREPADLAEGLKDGLFELDRELRSFPSLKSGSDRSGSTATTAFVTPSHIIIGNCGDSRSVLVSGGKVVFASEDHKPTNESERRRIMDAGGHVQIGRVCGNLAVSRSLGDFTFKDTPHLPENAQKVSAEADITVLKRSDDDEFLLLACDGIWDVASCDHARDFITEHLKAGVSAGEICERLLDSCLQKQSKDNMTAVLVLFEKGCPKPVPGYSPATASPASDQSQKGPARAAASDEAMLSGVLGFGTRVVRVRK
jgi:protein phosphatase 1B